jgi:hypothetical protein
MKIEEIKKQYSEQNNACTAYPIYIVVQELQFICVLDDSYGHNRDGEIRFEYSYEDWEDAPFKSKGDAVESILEHYGEETASIKNKMISSIEEFPCLYLWVDVEYFLTRNGAEEYLKMNQHNLGKTRTYVRHFSRRNHEMRFLLDHMGFKTEDSLIKSIQAIKKGEV